ncbi:MMPL family transporter [Terrabacter terrae]|uniref:MMPL family transporter n=1 Tax=Terrabacter terrae TaxID=318434 RepID=UPI0031E2D901
MLISRYRDELRSHSDRREAMSVALGRTAEAVLSSAVTVVIGLLTLLLSLFPATRGLGLACAVGVVVAAAFVLLVCPPRSSSSTAGSSGRASLVRARPHWPTGTASGAGSATGSPRTRGASSA